MIERSKASYRFTQFIKLGLTQVVKLVLIIWFFFVYLEPLV